jgi:hypothetical protein
MTRGANLGEVVNYGGRRCVVFGFTHAGTDESHVLLKDVLRNELLTVPLAELCAGVQGA